MTWRQTRGGYELLFNRDELTTRGPESAPAIGERGGIATLAPTDGDHGGTWITVNELGVSACLLNGYFLGSGAPPPHPTSRGLLVRELGGALSVRAAIEHLECTDLARYSAFVMVLAEPTRPVAGYEWDGSRRTLVLDADRHLPLVSSGVAPDSARAERKRIFAELVRDGLTSEALRAFHASHGSTGPNAATPCMHRADAGTRSSTRVLVTMDAVRMFHTPGAPCQTPESPGLELPRETSTAPA
ncbi:MAG: NRDE family protein [bacterium]|nr:NRDE family protein [bacterium]